ncbi:hypothetical protein M0R72_22045 [Candidatus Pacearchaeota archaeon]|jgi:hypothetical protein|nr:hypothetical protein [Candidatus Pacearchaeota archaeon]
MTGPKLGPIGITIPSEAPSPTTNMLYNSGGSLMFNGAAIGGGGCGTTVGTESWCDYVTDGTADEVQFNAAIAAVAAGAKPGPIYALEGTYTIAASINPVSYTQIIGLGTVVIQTASDIDMINAVQVGTDICYRIWLENLALSYTGSANYTHYHVLLHSPSSCRLNRIITYNNAVSYSASLLGGVYCVANQNLSWLNIFDDCEFTRLEFYRISDSVVHHCALSAINSGTGAVLGPYAVVIGLNCNNVTFEKCHIICDKNAGIYVNSAIHDLQILNSYFEPSGAAYISGNEEFGIYLGAVVSHSAICGNSFVGLGGIAIHAPAGIKFSIISGNKITDCNAAANAMYSDIRIAGSSAASTFNVVMGNTHLNTVSSAAKAAAIQEVSGELYPPNYNAITGNTASGYYIATAIIKVGAQSLTTGNIED